MNSKFENGILTFYFEGKIDSANAPQTQSEIDSICANAAYDHIVIDAEKLEYITSAGLRVILRLRKSDSGLKIINVSTDVYEIFDMTGFSEMMTIEKAYRKMTVDGCEVLGEGSNGVVYRYDAETVVKVYRNSDALDDIHRERELARKALILGIPTAIPFDVVKVGDKYASVFELLNAKSFSKLIKAEPDKIKYYCGLFVDLLKQIHSTEVNPTEMPDMKAVAVNWAEFLKGHLPNDTYDKLIKLVSSVPDRSTMIHGDYHTNNVEMQNGEVLLIDMDTLSYGHPVFELASMYLAFVGFGELNPNVTLKFLGLPYDVTGEIWRISIDKYFEGQDAAYIEDIKNKAKVIAYTRLMRRTIRREADTAEGQRLIENCKKHLIELTSCVDSLDF